MSDELTDLDLNDEDLEDVDLDEDIDDDLDFEDDDAAVDEDLDEDEEDDEDDDDTEALDELEAEELELLEDEVSATLPVDEAAELRAIRREELSLNVAAQSARTDEFVCSSCFLVKRISQLANKRKMLCADCAG